MVLGHRNGRVGGGFFDFLLIASFPLPITARCFFFLHNDRRQQQRWVGRRQSLGDGDGGVGHGVDPPSVERSDLMGHERQPRFSIPRLTSSVDSAAVARSGVDANGGVAIFGSGEKTRLDGAASGERLVLNVLMVAGSCCSRLT